VRRAEVFTLFVTTVEEWRGPVGPTTFSGGRQSIYEMRTCDSRQYRFHIEYQTDVRYEQRGLEQVLHDRHRPPKNKIRPISPRNPNRARYMDATYRFLRQKMI
jgi:hypothetical protein